MIHRNIPQPIQFYDSKAQRDRETCPGQSIDGPIFAMEFTENFVIERDTDAASDFNLYIFGRDTNTNYGLSGAIIQVLTIGTKDYLFHLPFEIAYTLKQGPYCFILTDGTHSYYSSWFHLSDCTDRMTLLSWRDTCKRTSMPWANAPSPFEFRFWADTRLGPSIVTTDETVEDDGTKETVTDIRTITRRGFTDVFPDHMLACFHAMKHHAFVTVQPANSDAYEGVKVGEITATPTARGCKQLITAQFIINEEWRGACCGEPECVQPCAEAYGNPGTHPLIEGNVYLLPDKSYGTWNGTDYDDVRQCLSGVASTTQADQWISAYWEGTEWRPAVALLDIEGWGTNTFSISGDIMPGFGAQIQYSLDGSSWSSVGEVFTADEVSAGVDVTMPDDVLSVRLLLVAEGCTVAESYPQAEAFACDGSQEANISFTSTSAILSTTGTPETYHTLRNSGTGVVVTADSFSVLEPGTFCMWPSDSAGVLTGVMDTLIATDVGLVVNVSRMTSLTALELYGVFTSLNLTNNTALTSLVLECQATTPPDLSANTLLVNLALNYPGDAPDLSGLTALKILSLTFTGSTVDLSALTALENLSLDSDALSTIDLSALVNLDTLNIAFVGPVLSLASNPDLVRLTINNPNLSNISLNAGIQFERVTIFAAALGAAYVDAICNKLDPTVTGKNSNIAGAGVAAPTAASLTARNAYIANGNTLVTN